MRSVSIIISFLLLSIYTEAQTEINSADEILSSAYKQAKKEHKNVIVIFHASWCVWCHKMDNSMNDSTCNKYFTDNYITVHLTVDEAPKNKNLETPGAAEFRKLYHGEKAGLPFFMILNKKGKLLGDSFIRPEGAPLSTAGENMGCPASASEVATFIAMLKKTSKLKDDQLAVIAERFKKNK